MNRKSGLTLIELLMAATITSILMIGVTLHLRGGITAWRRATAVVDGLGESRAALDQLAQDLANAVVIDTRPTAVPQTAFSQEALQCYTLRSARTGAEVQWVTYALADQSSGKALVRSAQPIQAARQTGAVTPQPILEHVDGWSLRYGYTAAEGAASISWRPTWDDTMHLPKLIDVTITFSRAAAHQPPIHQVLVIPTGIIKSAE